MAYIPVHRQEPFHLSGELICPHGQNAILAAQKKEPAFQDPPHHTRRAREPPWL